MLGHTYGLIDISHTVNILDFSSGTQWCAWLMQGHAGIHSQ